MNDMRAEGRLKVLRCVIAGMLVLGAGCAKSDADVAGEASARLHEQFNKSSFHDMYRGASDFLHNNITEDVFTDRLGALRQRVGEIVAVEKAAPWVGPEEPPLDGHDDVSLISQYFSLKTTNDRCDEFILWRVKDKRSEMSDYIVYCDSKFKMHVP